MARFKFISERRRRNRALPDQGNDPLNFEAATEADRQTEPSEPARTDHAETENPVDVGNGDLQPEDQTVDNEVISDVTSGSNETRNPSPIISRVDYVGPLQSTHVNENEPVQDPDSDDESTVPGEEGIIQEGENQTSNIAAGSPDGNVNVIGDFSDTGVREEHELVEAQQSIEVAHPPQATDPHSSIHLGQGDEHIGSTLTEEFIRQQNYCVVSEAEALPELSQSLFTDLPEFSFEPPAPRVFPTFPTTTFANRRDTLPEETPQGQGLRTELSENVSEPVEVQTLNTHPPRPYVVIQQGGERDRRSIRSPIQRPRHRSISSDEERGTYNPVRSRSDMPNPTSFLKDGEIRPGEQKRKRPRPPRSRIVTRGRATTRAGFSGEVGTSRDATIPMSLNSFRVLSREIALQAVSLYAGTTTEPAHPEGNQALNQLFSTEGAGPTTTEEAAEDLSPNVLPGSPGTVNSDDLPLSHLLPTHSRSVLDVDMIRRYPHFSLSVSGPTDPDLYPTTYFCRVCRISISLEGKGTSAILKHTRTETHLRSEQRYRHEMGLPVYNRAGRRMTDEEIQQEQALFMLAEPIFLAPRRRLVADEFCGPDLMETEPLDILGRQIQMLLSLLRRGGSLDMLIDLWGIVGEHTLHSNGTTNFDWRPRRVFVSTLNVFLLCYLSLLFELFSDSILHIQILHCHGTLLLYVIVNSTFVS